MVYVKVKKAKVNVKMKSKSGNKGENECQGGGKNDRLILRQKLLNIR